MPGVVHGVVVDTAHFKGNHPESARVEGIDAEGAGAADLAGSDARWGEILPRTRLAADRAHVFEPPALSPADATGTLNTERFATV